MKSGNLNFLETSGPLQTCNGTALPLTILYKNVLVSSYLCGNKFITQLAVCYCWRWDSTFKKFVLQKMVSFDTRLFASVINILKLCGTVSNK
jgi:hypothetical protein